MKTKEKQSFNRCIGAVSGTQQHAYHFLAHLAAVVCGPFKTYGKSAFTPEVPPQVLVQGHLVDVDPTTATL